MLIELSSFTNKLEIIPGFETDVSFDKVSVLSQDKQRYNIVIRGTITENDEIKMIQSIPEFIDIRNDTDGIGPAVCEPE